MKVILIKPYLKNKPNEIIEVADGFAKNYLIKNGIAQPVNKSTLANLEKVKSKIADNLEKEIYNATLLKGDIESLTLKFSLKSNGLIVHGHITNKAIVKELNKHNITVPKHALGPEEYNTFGEHIVPIKLHSHVTAHLKIIITEEK